MDSILIAANWLLPLLYLALVIDYGATFSLRVRTTARSPWLLAVTVVHAANLALYGVCGGWHLLASPYAVPSVLALSMAVVYVIIELATHDRRTGVFILTLVFLLQYTSTIFFSKIAEGFSAPSTEQSSWSHLHIIPAILAYTVLGFAAVYGLLYVLVRHGLKQHRFGVLFDRLPPMEMLGRMTWHALLTGFIFMTLTMAAAPLMVSAQTAAGRPQPLNAKVLAKIITGIVAWVIYGTATLGRLIGHWAPGRIAGIAVAGFVIVLILLVASGILS